MNLYTKFRIFGQNRMISAPIWALTLLMSMFILTPKSSKALAMPSENAGKGTEATKMLKSKIFHETRDLFEREAPKCKCARMEPAAAGTLFSDTFPTDKIKAVSLRGDQVDMPSILAAQALAEGKFKSPAKLKPAANDCPGRVWLTDGNCIALTFHVDGDHRLTEIETPIGILSHSSAVSLAGHAADIQVKIKTGMTRGQVEKLATNDGGISVPFKYERYVLTPTKPDTHGAVAKVNLSFKPAGMSDVVYYLGKWAVPKQSPGDTVMRISPIYSENPFCD